MRVCLPRKTYSLNPDIDSMKIPVPIRDTPPRYFDIETGKEIRDLAEYRYIYGPRRPIIICHGDVSEEDQPEIVFIKKSNKKRITVPVGPIETMKRFHQDVEIVIEDLLGIEIKRVDASKISTKSYIVSISVPKDGTFLVRIRPRETASEVGN